MFLYKCVYTACVCVCVCEKLQMWSIIQSASASHFILIRCEEAGSGPVVRKKIERDVLYNSIYSSSRSSRTDWLCL